MTAEKLRLGTEIKEDKTKDVLASAILKMRSNQELSAREQSLFSLFNRSLERFAKMENTALKNFSAKENKINDKEGADTYEFDNVDQEKLNDYIEESINLNLSLDYIVLFYSEIAGDCEQIIFELSEVDSSTQDLSLLSGFFLSAIKVFEIVREDLDLAFRKADEKELVIKQSGMNFDEFSEQISLNFIAQWIDNKKRSEILEKGVLESLIEFINLEISEYKAVLLSNDFNKIYEQGRFEMTDALKYLSDSLLSEDQAD